MTPRHLSTARDFVLICATVAAVTLALVVVALTSLTLVGVLFSVPFAATLIDAFR